MMDPKIYPVCVIGGGSAGTMAVLRTILNNDECLFFPGTPKDKKKSRALWVRKVENMPAHFQYKRGIEEPNAEVLRWIGDSTFKTNLQTLKNTGVTSLSKKEGVFEITDSKGQAHRANHIILCTGVMDVQPQIQGSIEAVFDYANAQTIDYCLICDGHHVLDKKTTIIGHENNAAWVAVILFERYGLKNFSILTNGKKPDFQTDTRKLLDLYGIAVMESPIKEIRGSEKGKVLEGFMLEDGSVVESEMCFVSLGMLVYNDLAKQLGAELDERGFVKGDETGLTSVEGLYVAGDLKAGTRKQIYTSWDMAVSAANAVNLRLRITRRKKFLENKN
ncbi:MAG TPA: NAD(P)/FAD-dependent oxidoreductase [Bacteriovoracaceae bacterium]|nr:NAD(P)/FAD-dependent oxidoreductase [Bacteriovoracaceae bacterium]